MLKLASYFIFIGLFIYLIISTDIEFFIKIFSLLLIISSFPLDYFFTSRKIRDLNKKIKENPNHLKISENRLACKTILENKNRLEGLFTIIEDNKLKKELAKYENGQNDENNIELKNNLDLDALIKKESIKINYRPLIISLIITTVIFFILQYNLYINILIVLIANLILLVDFFFWSKNIRIANKIISNNSDFLKQLKNNKFYSTLAYQYIPRGPFSFIEYIKLHRIINKNKLPKNNI